jgi:predicted O-linked N-acetylglucosamine transferase (SPINDLY family)
MLLRLFRTLLGDGRPERLVARGERAFAAGDYAGAVRDLSAALERLAPDDARRTPLELRLAIGLYECQRLPEAERVLRALLERDPDCPGALIQLAMLRFVDSDAAQARGLMERYIARHADAGSRLRRALMLPMILQSKEHIDRVRAELEADLERLARERLQPLSHPEGEVLLTPFYLAYHARNNRELLGRLCRAYRTHYAARTQIGRRLFAHGTRLRVGFVSSFFHLHSVGRTTCGLIKDLPRERFDVHVFAIAPRNDALAQSIRAAADEYVALPGDVERARAAIEAAELDILVFADVGMHPVTTFLALWRLAPLQMTTWGHSVTSGIDTIDYYISSDDIEPPAAQELYSEKLVRLPGFFLPRYERPAPVRAPGGGARHAYFCPQSLFKLHPDFDSALKGILERDANGEIVLLGGNRAWEEALRRRFARSLGPAAGRVRFTPPASHAEFLGHIARADVIIDPFHFGGCNTSCEALSLGVPVVTLPAFQLPGRFTMGLYREIGIDACIARSEKEFVDIAVRLRTQPEHRRAVSAQISERAAALFERPDTGRILGEELLRLAETASSGR